MAEINFGLLKPSRTRMYFKGRKFYVATVLMGGVPRLLKCVSKTATGAQWYAERVVAKGRRLQRG